MTRTRQRLAATAMLAALAASPAGAQMAPANTNTVDPIGNEQGEILPEIAPAGRTASDSRTPVDAITRDQLEQSGRVDLNQQPEMGLRG